MRNAKDLLARLTASFPPDENRRHAIMLNDSDELEIQLALNGKFQPVVITGNSLDVPSGMMAVEVAHLLREALE